MYASLTIKGQTREPRQVQIRVSGLWVGGVICLGEPTDLSGLLYSCFQRTLVHKTYFKMKQSSLKTVNHSYKFTCINIISWSLSVPVNVWTVPVGTYREMHSSTEGGHSLVFFESGCSFRDLRVPQKPREDVCGLDATLIPGNWVLFCLPTHSQVAAKIERPRRGHSTRK